MKKMLTAVILLGLTFLLCLPGAATEELFSDMYAMYRYWHAADSFPDYVCGVWVTKDNPGCLTVSVLENAQGEAGKKEILAGLADPSCVRFVYGKYSLNTLIDVQAALDEQLQNESLGLDSWSTMLSEEENCIVVALDFENADAALLNAVAEWQESYGDQVRFESGGGTITDTTLGIATSPQTTPSGQVMLGMLLIAVLAAGGFLTVVFFKRRNGAAVTVSGTVAADIYLSAKQVKTMVQDSACAPSAEFDRKMLDMIDGSET